MSKSRSKKKQKASGAAKISAPATVNTLGIDIEPVIAEPEQTASASPETEISGDRAPEELYGFELPDEDIAALDEEPPFTAIEKIISYSTLTLSMLLLGGSLVFWWIIGRHLLLDPSKLVDSDQMRAILITCAIIPALVTAVQALLRRAISIERWLVCMCISGALAALIIIIYQLGIRGVEFTFADYPTLICCTVSGCTLPSAIYLGIRRLIPVAVRWFRRNSAPANAENWQDISEDICSMTDFDL